MERFSAPFLQMATVELEVVTRTAMGSGDNPLLLFVH